MNSTIRDACVSLSINIPHSGTGDGGIGDYLHGIAWGNCFVYAYGDDDGGEDYGGA